MNTPTLTSSGRWTHLASVAMVFALVFVMACEPQPQTDDMDEDTTAADTTMMDNTIVDVAVSDGRFATLVTAVDSTDLVETLSGPGPFTVFAPTDSAFGALPEGTVADLLQPGIRISSATSCSTMLPVEA